MKFNFSFAVIMTALLYFVILSSCGKEEENAPNRQEQNSQKEDYNNEQKPNDQSDTDEGGNNTDGDVVVKYVVSLPDGSIVELDKNSSYLIPSSYTNSDGWLVKYYVDGQDFSGQEIIIDKDICISQKLFAVGTLPDGSINEVEIGGNEVVVKKINYYMVKSTIIYDVDDVTELTKVVQDYDEYNRLIGWKSYFKGDLISELFDYNYNGLNCTYLGKTYNSDVVDNYKVTYLDNYYDKMLNMEIYRDGELYEEFIYRYDDDKCQSYFSLALENKLISEYKNVRREGLRLSYDIIGDDVINHYEIEYLDQSFTKILKQIVSYSYTTNQVVTENVYDEYGRCVETRSYNNSILSWEYADYEYNGNTATYYYKVYNNDGTLSSKSKYKVEYL